MKKTSYFKETLIHTPIIKNGQIPKWLLKKTPMQNLTTTNETLFIQRSLAPAKISGVELDTVNKKVAIYLNADQLSLAFGKSCANIELASALSGYEIKVYTDVKKG